jgi:hypothetical protein
VYQPRLSFAASVAKAEAERERLKGLRRKQAGQRQGGRGHKRNFTQNPESSLRDRNANSAAGRLAAKTGMSRYKVEQALKII